MWEWAIIGSKRIKANNFYDPWLQAVRDNPYPVLAQLRQQQPIIWHERLQFWLVLSYACGRELLLHKDFIENPLTAICNNIYPRQAVSEITPVCDALQQWLVFSNPPYHTHLRRLLTPYFSQNCIDGLDVLIEEHIQFLLSKLPYNFDLLSEFAKPLTMRVMMSLLGLPMVDINRIIQWVDAIAAVINNLVIVPDIYRPAIIAIQAAKEYLTEQIAMAISKSEKNFIVEIYTALRNDKHLSEDLTWDVLFMLLSAGYETSSNLIANGVLALLQHPNQMEKLRAHPEHISTAIDEMLRYEPSVQSVLRQAVQDIPYHDVIIKKNDFVYFSLLAMNRDPMQFPQPDSFDITRTPNSHVTFGHGVHLCLGRLLARKTTQLAIMALLQNKSSIKLATTSLQWHAGLTLRKLKTLPVVL